MMEVPDEGRDEKSPRLHPAGGIIRELGSR